jgi:hypothetical protein
VQRDASHLGERGGGQETNNQKKDGRGGGEAQGVVNPKLKKIFKITKTKILSKMVHPCLFATATNFNKG